MNETKEITDSVAVRGSEQNGKPKLERWTREWLSELRGSTFVIVITVTLAIFTDILAYSIVVPVVPFAFTERMGVPESGVQTQVAISLAVYSAGLIVGSLAIGYIADRLRRRQELMIGGLFLFIAATIMLCVAKAVWLYMLGRVFQGLSAAVVWTVGLAIIADTGTADNMAFLMSFPGIGSAVGIFFGPFLGGVVYKKAGYYAVFYVCFGALILDIVLRLFMLEKGQLRKYRHERAVQLSNADSATLSPELFAYMERYLQEPVSSGEADKAKQREMQDLYGDHITVRGKRYKVPLLLSLMRHPRVANAVLLGIALAWMQASLDTTIPLHLADIFGYDSLQSGLVFLALAVPCFVEPVFGWLTDRYGPKVVVTSAYILMIPPLICLRIPSENTIQDKVLLVAMIALIGLFLVAIGPPTMAEMTKAVTKLEAKHPGIYGKTKGYGQAYALFNTGYSIGTLVGPFHSGLTKEHAGWNTMVLSLAMVCLGVAIIAFFFTGGNILKKRTKDVLEEPEVLSP